MSEPVRYLSFGLGEEEFAIPLLSVKEVIGIPEITPVPQTPSYFLGIMNLRGSVISIMDLRQKLSIKSNSKEEETVVILDLGGFNLGVVVDRVDSVLSLLPEQINSKPHIESRQGSDYITGVYRHQDRLILLLDIAKALSLEDHSAVNKGHQSAAA